MLLLSIEKLPDRYSIIEIYPMIQFTRPVQISDKGLIRGVLERKRNEYQEALDGFAELAPEEANAIIGVKVSSSAQQFRNAAFLYLTYIGTPVKIEKRVGKCRHRRHN